MLKDIKIKYSGKSNNDLSKVNFFLGLNIIPIPKTIEVIKNGVGRLMPNGSKKKAM